MDCTSALVQSDPVGSASQRAVRALRLAESGRAVLMSQALEPATT
ncbi:hypothetical protein ACFVRD_15950 [Streptomyces sp. NPDC057908]